MWGKVLGVCLVLAVGGGAAGYAVAESRPETPARIDRTQPVVASGPAFPTTPAVTCPADPTEPPLDVDLPTSSLTLNTGGKNRGYRVDLAVPVGWEQARPDQTMWKFTPPDYPLNTYLLRVTVVAGQHQAVSVVKQARIAAYDSAVREGNLGNFDVESDTDDTFVATYTERGYCRLTFERVLSLGSSSAYVDLAVTGRFEDRQGLMDLLARTTASMTAG